MADKDGATIICESLKGQAVDYMFGIVGIPVVEVGYQAQLAGIKYIGMRNEQSASYAASIVGYLSRRPAACLVVPGPGLIHALAGIVNSSVNCWPLVVIAGSFDKDQVSMGGFQEWDQLSSVKDSCKYSARIETLESIPYHIEKAVKFSIYGRPGPTYIEIPGNFITETIPASNISYPPSCPDPPITIPTPDAIRKAADAIKGSIRPLVVIGKGAAYGRADNELRQLLVVNHLPFLPTPMGKGVVSDDHPLCVAAARSKALREADVILLVGARLNWILHFGKPPRFDANVKIIQVDICPEEMNNNVPSHVMLCGDVKHTIQLISDELYSDSSYGGCDRQSKWWTELLDKVNSNVTTNKMLSDDESVPMSFYCAYKQITKYLPPDAVVVNEGANTMDVGRTVIPSHYPRLRLDAGTFGTMGVGCGFAIAAALYNQATSADNKAVPPVYCIQGDSAFGFSGMELETACRYRLPIIFIIMNNSGIYRGVSADQWEEIYKGNDLMIKYDKMAECFGCRGFDVTTPLQLREAVEWAMNNVGSLPTVINVHINPSSERKQQEFPWLTKSNL